MACEESVAGGDSAPAVAIGSDRGLPVPGEAALIAAGLLAGSGRRTKTIFLGRWTTGVRAVAAAGGGAILAGTRGWWRRRRVCARAAATVTAAGSGRHDNAMNRSRSRARARA